MKSRTVRARKSHTALSRDRADRARALRKLEEKLDESKEELFTRLNQFSDLPTDVETLTQAGEFVEFFDDSRRRVLCTPEEYNIMMRKQIFLLTLEGEYEARSGIFRDSQAVIIQMSPLVVILRQFLSPKTCRKRLALIAGREGYDAERAWLLAKLT